ncbi:MAG: choice-of-anchor D domain-containing protein [candidate division KSB1 bacterium]|nr:choice-of-anchor D domain-containing protein [candidate division KSB1 bacterium]
MSRTKNINLLILFFTIISSLLPAFCYEQNAVIFNKSKNLWVWHTIKDVYIYWLDTEKASYYNIYWKEIESDKWSKINKQFITQTQFTLNISSINSNLIDIRVQALTKENTILINYIIKNIEIDLGSKESLKKQKLTEYSKNYVTSNDDFLNYQSMSISDIQYFLENVVNGGSFLSDFKTEDIDGVVRSAAEIIFNASQNYHSYDITPDKINPQVIITTLQKEQSLIYMNSKPDDRVLLKAMGYEDPSFYGFAQQINAGTWQLRKNWQEIETFGQKIGWGVDITKLSEDGIFVTPTNIATADLYVYTPYVGATWGGSYGGNYLYSYIFYNSFNFGSSAQIPTVETKPASAIIKTAAILNAKITDNGSSNITERRFDWGTSENDNNWSSDNWVSDDPSSSYYGDINVSGDLFWFNLSNLNPGTQYYFRAWAKNNSGWAEGEILSFETIASIKPVLLYPNNNSHQSCKITFEWEPVPNASNYKIYIKAPGWTSFESGSSNGNTSYDYHPKDEGEFQWKVKAYVNGEWSDYSEEWTFYFDGLNAPELEFPNNNSNISETQPTFQWNSVSCAENYLFEIAKDINFSNKVKTQYDILNTYFQIDESLNPGNTYYWRVRSGKPIGNWSDIFSFSIEQEEYVTVPNRPSGPSTAKVGQPLSFSTGGSSSNLENPVEYQYKWGDGNTSSWGASSRNHSYNSSGSFQIQSRARSQVNTNVVSDWSSAKTVSISYCNLTIAVNPAGSGTVAKSPDKTNFEYNESVTLQAFGAQGYQFDHWGGDLSGAENFETVIMDQDKQVTAYFDETMETVSTPSTPTGPSTGEVGESLSFSTGGAASNLDHSVEYQFDWHNGTLSSWGSSTRSHSFTSPGSKTVKARARSQHNTSVVSNWSNTITVQISQNDYITLIQPNGGESWQVGQQKLIEWESSGTSGTVKIQYSTNAGANWSIITSSTSDDGQYRWTIPNTPSTNCLVKLSDTDGSPVAESSEYFEITSEPAISITSPNGGETWQVKSQHSIRWDSEGTSGAVTILYSTNSGTSWHTIVSGTSDDGQYLWTVPNEPSSNCLIKISDYDGFPIDQSDHYFTITSAQEDPEISRSPQTLNNTCIVGHNALDQSFEISNSGGGTLSYSIRDNCSWLSCTPNSGVLASESDIITIHYTTSDLSPGNYSAVITIKDSNASNSPQTVSVSLTARPKPETNIITNLSPGTYIADSLDEGDPYYIDRDYTISNIPAAFEKLLWIQTANDDKEETSNPFISFDASRDVTVYIAYDGRAISKPSWITQQFSNTGQSIGVSEVKVERLYLWEKEFQSGTIQLGGNKASGAVFDGTHISNYVVLIKARELDPPDIAVSPSSYHFGIVKVNETKDHSFSIHNTGEKSLNISSVSIDGNQSDQFSIKEGAGSFSINPDYTHELIISFRPQTAGEKTAYLKIYSNDPDENPKVLTLVGTGEAEPPEISISRYEINFGELAIEESRTEMLSILNAGGSTLNVTSLSISGDHSDQFKFFNNHASFSLSVNESHDLHIQFSPTSAGEKHAILNIVSDDPDESKEEIALIGNGIEYVPEVHVVPTACQFDNTAIGSSQFSAIHILNSGKALLTVSKSQITGADSSQFFIQSGAAPFNLEQDSTHTMNIGFSPTSAGDKTALLNLACNDPDHSQINIPLQGSIATSVEFIQFNAEQVGEHVKLLWTTRSESNNAGFDIQRANDKKGGDWEKLAFIKGNGTSNSMIVYEYMDETISEPGEYIYRLKQINLDASFSYSPVTSLRVNPPATFALHQNYPNPFNPGTIITYHLTKATHVRLEVYNILGEKVATLVDEYQKPGFYRQEFNAEQLQAGIYVYKIKAGEFTQMCKMTLLK